MKTRINMVGQRFGRLLVTEYGYTDNVGKIYWKCVCDCSIEKTMTEPVKKIKSAKQL